MSDLKTDNLKGFEIKFKTRPGVFSKDGVDLGTKLLVEKMEVQDGTMVADLGCGTGILGLVAGKLNPRGHVHMLDVNLKVVKLAQENIELNHLTNVEVFLSDLFSEVQKRTYQQIFSNPPQHLGGEFLEELVAESFKHLKPNGELWLVMQKNLKSTILPIMERNFADFEIILNGKDYLIVKGVKNG